MKSSRLLFRLFLGVGVLLLLMPLGNFHFHAGAVGKWIALRHLTLSLAGLALIVVTLASHYFVRRTGAPEDTQA